MLIDHGLEVVGRNSCLIFKHMVVGWASCALNSRVGGQIWKVSYDFNSEVAVLTEIVLERMSNVALNQSTRKRVFVLVTSGRVAGLWEKANVMTLGAHRNSPFDLSLLVKLKKLWHEASTHVLALAGVQLLNHLLHVGHLLIKDVRVLTFRDTITEVIDVHWEIAATNLLDPLGKKETEETFNVSLCDHLNSVTIGLNTCSVAAGILVKGHGQCSHGSLLTTRRSVRDISA